MMKFLNCLSHYVFLDDALQSKITASHVPDNIGNGVVAQRTKVPAPPASPSHRHIFAEPHIQKALAAPMSPPQQVHMQSRAAREDQKSAMAQSMVEQPETALPGQTVQASTINVRQRNITRIESVPGQQGKKGTPMAGSGRLPSKLGDPLRAHSGLTQTIRHSQRWLDSDQSA